MHNIWPLSSSCLKSRTYHDILTPDILTPDILTPDILTTSSKENGENLIVVKSV